jgi:hypothetical protein
VSDLALARPDQVQRAAALLGASADELGTAISACRRSADVAWVGRANEQYQARLAGLATGLTGVRGAFDDACEALLSYARALAWAQPLAEEAARLDADPSGEALIEHAMTLRATAEEAEAAAAARLVAVLNDLADRAARTSGWTTAAHHAADFAQGLDDAVKGIGSTLLAAVHSLPGIGSRSHRAAARHQVVETVEDTLQPWKQVKELYTALTDGHAWYAGGQLTAAAIFRFRGDRVAGMDLFGAHDELPDRVMRALHRGALPLAGDAPVDVWLAEHLRRELVRALLTFEQMPLPLLEELDLHGVDLVHQEAWGGHTLQRHVGRDPDFLRERQRWEPDTFGDPKNISSFSTLDEAERLVADALRIHQVEVSAFLANPRYTRFSIEEPLDTPVGTLIDARGMVVPAGTLVVKLIKVDGTVRVHTAYLNP